MKKLYLIISCTILFFNSCEKDVATSSLIKGEWELRTAINGSTGTPTNYSSGNGTVLKFTETNYENYSGGKLIKSGSYKIVKDISAIKKEVFDRILYDNEYNSVKIFFKIENNKLNTWVDGYDAPATIYEKK